ncbi:uncharacterized protein LOC126609685 isoform X1 [Malus sylvestris]|uniref:uncharacterized protein LOC126609685 isoform X1 n=1 Tax=Malus sylvestris TaxID=3752 RepID=UPI0021AD004C|nr:uncharacterized protein LOC126609685 isoform X1 [Malus sylvestris]
MSAINITNVTVLDNPALDNPALFLAPFQFEISYDCNTAFKDDLEWKLIYVGSAEDETYDHANTFTRKSGQTLHQITAEDDVSKACSWNWSIFPTGFLLPNEVLTRHPPWAGHIPDDVP